MWVIKFAGHQTSKLERWIRQLEDWVYDGRTGSGVNRVVYILLLCIHCMYCPTVGWGLNNLVIHSWEQQVQEAITSPLQLRGCVFWAVNVFVQVWGWWFEWVRVCVGLYASLMNTPSFNKTNHLQFAFQQFSDLLHINSGSENTQESWICCEKGREEGLFLLKQTAVSISMTVSLWCLTVHLRESANVCVLTQSPPPPSFLLLHKHTAA